MSKRFKVLLVVITLLFGGTFLWYVVRGVLTRHFLKNFQFPPAAVSTIILQNQTVLPKIEAVGVIAAIDAVDISSTVPGQVVSIAFSSGEVVHKGQVLLELDHATDEHSLESAQAQGTLDALNYKRLVYLRQRGAVAQADLDVAKANWLRSQASIKSAEVLLEKKTLRAPFAGKIGISAATVGQYFSPGQPMVNLQSVGKYYVNFSLPERDLGNVHVGQIITATLDSEQGSAAPIQAKITAIAPAVDEATHTVQVQATTYSKVAADFIPGRFVKVSVLRPARKLLMAPKTAISYSLYGNSVYVVKESKDSHGESGRIAEQRFVVLGLESGEKVAIQSGLQAGEEVVTAGQVKLQPGARIVVENNISLDKKK